jgi:hypothetical protein
MKTIHYDIGIISVIIVLFRFCGYNLHIFGSKLKNIILAT